MKVMQAPLPPVEVGVEISLTASEARQLRKLLGHASYSSSYRPEGVDKQFVHSLWNALQLLVDNDQ